ncbi:UNVERIFIED_CONTAM: putative enoyl-CoA hydratase 2, mitochondrial [Sesamum latifolium]|uniref:Enoyl-CoA hydratase 2, mitochondrial n=1 Tax=Sesamum latifolium TaxID=2727402 RepID=A0AAW2W046_9LAMI
MNGTGEDAVLGLPETGLAIIPRAGGTQRLPRLVGNQRLRNLYLLVKRLVAEMPCPWINFFAGLVNYCATAGEAGAKALEIARDINQKGPLAIRMAKRAIDGGAELDMASALALEEDCYEQLLHTKDRSEGLAAFAERRKPNYKGE